jgi:thiosulfate/3-mercaptopyruvate sulfurtransferase
MSNIPDPAMAASDALQMLDSPMAYAHPEVLVDTQWLEDHLSDSQVRVLEVDMSPDLYQQAHIPGAVFWSIFADLLNPDLSLRLDSSAIAQLLARSGITPETTVIAYGSYPGTGAWIFWLLKTLGHQPVRVLDGGYQKWQVEGRPLASELGSVAPTPYPTSELNHTLRVLQPEVFTALGQPNCVLLDVRTPEEYRGEIFMMQPPTATEQAGHIPGAIHLEHTQTLAEDGTYRSARELQNLFHRHGITPDRTIFPYCAIGGRSASVWFVLTQLLGYPNVRNYDGSWNQWSRLLEMPVAMGG